MRKWHFGWFQNEKLLDIYNLLNAAITVAINVIERIARDHRCRPQLNVPTTAQSQAHIYQARLPPRYNII